MSSPATRRQFMGVAAALASARARGAEPEVPLIGAMDAVRAAMPIASQDQGLAVFAADRPASRVRAESLKAMPMKPASGSLDHFHA